MLTILHIACIIVAGALVASTRIGAIQKVVNLLESLESKVNKQAAAAAIAHQEYAAWCVDRSRNLEYEIKTGKAQADDLNAAIVHAESSLELLSSKIDDNLAQVAADQGDLKAATAIRSKEKTDFVAEEKELVEIVDMLQRAIQILQRELHKGGAAMVQFEKARSIVHAFGIMVEASMIPARDAAKLTSLVQNSQQEEESWGAPDAAVYESRSGTIIETLEDLLEKAQGQLVDARAKETAATHNFEMLKQSLEDSIKFANQQLSEAKMGYNSQAGLKTTAQSDLTVTTKTLTEGEKTLSTFGADCAAEAASFDAQKKSRSEELKALSEAKKVIMEMTSGAGALSYNGQATFAQLAQSGLKTSVDLVNFEVVRFVRKIAQQQHSETLSQLSKRIASVVSGGTRDDQDPFSKVKAMITQVIARLESDANSDASHKAYCDSELGDTLEKKENRDASAKKLSAQIDTMIARSAKLKQEVADLQKALAFLAKTQAEMTTMRQAQNKQYLANKAEMEQGLTGIKMGLKLLREYYAGEGKAHAAATGSANGIIGLLEVIESDFTKTFAEITEAETTSQTDYDEQSRQNEIERVTKDQDVSYKGKEIAQLKNIVAETTSDLQGVRTELTAIIEYNAKLLNMCEEKPETYAGRRERREAEIAGLKEALSILQGEMALVQRKSMTIQRRGLHHAHLATSYP